MDTERWKRLEALFIEALERSPGDRLAFLAEACSNDPDLYEELASMLSANEQSMALELESRLLSDETRTKHDPADLTGTHIGLYRLEKLIGEGGMGEVYLAQRDDDQYRQKVALKLVRAGYSNRQIVARFRLERQVLARLTHPNITQLLDGGIDEMGRPYLVLQYVEGLPITEYCDKHALSIDERLALFMTVCAAVQHAHRNLIVHRDLKPSNILVTEEGVVKLLDFGIAKLLNPDWEMSAAITQSQMRLMTPEYAAPEQIKGGAITTATDVYALGVLLYEILSGRRPYWLRHRVQSEIERIICEVDPARPSTAVTETEQEADSRLKTTPEAVSRARGTGISRLKKMLQGDLDNIVLMALRKEPTRRYSSAAQLSEDIDRYRNGLPIHAQKASLSYRMRKFASRHRATVFFSALFVVVLVGFSAVTAYQGRLLKVERDTARIEKNRAEQVIELLVSLFETANPSIVPGGDTLSVGEFVERGAARTLEAVANDSTLAIEIKHTLGRMYAAQGNFREGHALLKEAYALREAKYGKDDSTSAAYLNALAVQTWRLGDDSTARLMFAELLDRYRRIFGPVHPNVAAGLENVALTTRDLDEKLRLLESSLAMRRALLPADHIDIAEGLNQLAIYYYQQSDCGRAIPMYEESLRILDKSLPPSHPNTLAVMNNLTSCLSLKGEDQAAIDLQREVIDRLATVKRDSSVQTANAWNNLAVFLTKTGSFDEADRAFRKALGIQTHLLGETHPRVISTMRNVGVIMGFLQKPAEGLPFLERALAMQEARSGMQNDKSTGYMRAQYALLLLETGQLEKAFAAGREAVRTMEEVTTPEDPQQSDVFLWWSIILLERGALDAAHDYAALALERRSSIFEPDHPKIAQAQCIAGRILAALGKTDEALALLQAGYPTYAAWPLANPKRVESARQTLDMLRSL